MDEAFDLLAAINDIVNRICGIRETNRVIEILLAELVKRTDSDESVISLLSPIGEDKVKSFLRLQKQESSSMPYQIINPISGWAIKNKRLLKIDDLDNDMDWQKISSGDGGFKRILCCPLIEQGVNLGTIILSRTGAKEPYSDWHSRLLGILGPQAAHFIATTNLLRELSESNHLLEIAQMKLREENRNLKNEIRHLYSFENISSKSPKMRNVISEASRYCQGDSPLLITGETGTGKEVLARAIHENSKRNTKPFIAVNMGISTPSLIEDKLFGHRKGAFSGAVRDQKGLFKMADGGTLFLDEIGDMPIEIQGYILRAIQSGEIQPLGLDRFESVDVRVISATNKNLIEEMKKGNFREDLYYRLNTFALELPPLRERTEDIPLLTNTFIKELGIQYNKDNLIISREALDLLYNYNWPGNIRQLRSVLESAVSKSETGIIEPAHLASDLRMRNTNTGISRNLGGNIKDAVKDLEKEMIVKTLEECEWNESEASRKLGLSRQGLINKKKKYGIRK